MKNCFIVLIEIFLLTVSVISYNKSELKYNETELRMVLFYLVISLLIFSFRCEKYAELKKNAIRISFLFIIAYLITYFQRYVDLLFGYIDLNDFSIALPYTVVRSAWVALSGLQSFFIGYLITSKGFPKKKCSHYISCVHMNKILWIIVGAYIGFVLTINPLYVNGGYGREIMGGALNGFFFIALESSLMAYLVIKIYNNAINPLNKSIREILFSDRYYLFLLFLYLIIVLLSGDRGPIMYFLLAYFVTIVFIRKLKLSYLSFFLLLSVASIIITILGISRNISDPISTIDKFQVATDFFSTREDVSILNATAELSNSIRTLQVAVASVSENGIWYGYFNVYQLVSAIPFGGTLLHALNLTIGSFTTSSTYITYYLQGPFPRYGDGSSCLADLYLDFGLYGVIIGLLFLGFLFRKIDLLFLNQKVPVLYITISLIYFSRCVYLTRAPFLFFCKLIVLTLLIVLFILIFSKDHMNKNLQN